MLIDFRTVILQRLSQLKKSRYWLAEQVQDNPSRNAIYSFLRGQHDMYGRHIARLLEVLQIDVAPRRPRKGQ